MSLSDHLATGLTTICRCWWVQRRDGPGYGFTDHDRELRFDDKVFRADTGLSTSEIDQTTGLSVDNSEVIGALSAAAVSEIDLLAGRFDGAEVSAWLVNWADTSQRSLSFTGTLGEVTRSDGMFRAELRGLSEALNRPVGQIFQKPCAARLGDARCGVSLDDPAFHTELAVETVVDARVFNFANFGSFAERWFDHGRLEVISGAAQGLSAIIKNDRDLPKSRQIELWERLALDLSPGDRVRLEAGCDKRLETCRVKFGNIANFRGFPHIPGEDWLMSYPSAQNGNTGGSRYS